MEPALGGDFATFREYIRYVADQVGLRDWTIFVLDDPPADPANAACISMFPHRKVAHVAFDKGWCDGDDETICRTVIHEMLHCHFEGIATALETLESFAGTAYAKPVLRNVDHNMELGIDAIATEWARTIMGPRAWLEAMSE